jgi:vacuolar-type H+-ATPase subunit I/STV1
MKTVCTLLGLSADADEASVHAAVSKLLNRGDIAPEALATLRAEHKSLGETNLTLLGEQLTGLLAEHGIKDARIINRLTPVLTPLKNREERVACLADLGFKTRGQAVPAPTRVLNRGGGAEAVATTDAGGADEQAVARKIKNRANELKGASPKRAFDDCWNQAASEIQKS